MWLLPPSGTPMRQELDGFFEVHGLRPLRAKLETTSLLLMETTLQRSSFVGVIAQSVAAHYASQGRLGVLKLDLDIKMPSVGLVTLAGITPSPALESFVNLVRTSIADAPS